MIYDGRNIPQELSVRSGIAQARDNGRQEERERIYRDKDTRVDDNLHPRLPVAQSLPHKLVIKVRSKRRGIYGQSGPDGDLLFGRKEASCLRIL